MNNIKAVLGQNIRHFRKELNWTQEKLAELSGISVPFMTQIELGRKSASLEVIENIAQALGVTYEKLFSGNTDNIAFSNYSIHLLEKNLIETVTDIIHNGFMQLN